MEIIQPKSIISIVNLRQREKSRSQMLKKYRNLGELNIKSQNLGSPKRTISVSYGKNISESRKEKFKISESRKEKRSISESRKHISPPLPLKVHKNNFHTCGWTSVKQIGFLGHWGRCPLNFQNLKGPSYSVLYRWLQQSMKCFLIISYIKDIA